MHQKTTSAVPPFLPVEIWQYVIRFATLAPSIFDTSLTSPLDGLWDPRPEVSQVDPRAVKLSVSMVCRAWQEVAKKYLFETVYLDSEG
jgi:hypothetical protein